MNKLTALLGNYLRVQSRNFNGEIVFPIQNFSWFLCFLSFVFASFLGYITFSLMPEYVVTIKHMEIASPWVTQRMIDFFTWHGFTVFLCLLAGNTILECFFCGKIWKLYLNAGMLTVCTGLIILLQHSILWPMHQYLMPIGF